MFRVIFLIIELVISGLSLMLGLILISKPADCIEIQQNFYKIINWKIEPLDYNKEIRNTRIMGVISFACGLGLLILLF